MGLGSSARSRARRKGNYAARSRPRGPGGRKRRPAPAATARARDAWTPAGRRRADAAARLVRRRRASRRRMTPVHPTPVQPAQAVETLLTTAERCWRYTTSCRRDRVARGWGERPPPVRHSVVGGPPPRGPQLYWAGQCPRVATQRTRAAAVVMLPGPGLTGTRRGRNARRPGLRKCWWNGPSVPSGGSRSGTRPKSA